ncbi:MAG: acyclic terpene utilization AtuA family protein [Pseudomonadota bacterium]
MPRHPLRTRPLRIGCAGAFWGDTEAGARQLVTQGEVDYLVFDFLAEITMSLLARARAKSPEAGYAPDFVRIIASLGSELQARGIKVISNAGGVNPRACAEALARELSTQGITLKIAVVEGDDLMPLAEEFRASGVREMFSQVQFPERLLSINAYLGAQPIAAALNAGADIVITGRGVDSAVALGPLVHEFGWAWNDWDKLAMGSLAGHVIECGTQATGGIFTDWERVPGWDNMGFPIAECEADGKAFVLTKPAGTGGLVEPATVAEQVIYEIGDPAAYLLPDVVCDFRQVTLQQDGPDRVRVEGARGSQAPSTLKVSATSQDGWRLLSTLMVGGIDAARKAQRVGNSIFARSRRLFAERSWPDYSETSLEVLGAESTYGPHARAGATREVILKIAARHPAREPLELLAREIAPSATAMAQGITGFAAGRATPSPVVRLFSFLVDRQAVQTQVSLDGKPVTFAEVHPPSAAAYSSTSSATSSPTSSTTSSTAFEAAMTQVPRHPPGSPSADRGAVQTVPLIRVAYARSGDKGDMSNIGVIARTPALFDVLREQLTTNVVRQYMGHVTQGQVSRFELPGFYALNFTLESALGGGGVASLRYDPQGKALAQMLLDLPIDVPVALLETLP